MPGHRITSALIAALLIAPLTASQTPAPVKLTEKDLQALRWIEGSWRGTGGGVPPFFERYRFDGPTTLLVDHLDGEKVTSTSRYALQNGEFASVGDKELVRDAGRWHEADVARVSVLVVSELVTHSWAVLGDVMDQGFAPWDDSPTNAIQRLEREWAALGRAPRLGEIGWLNLTELGASEAAKRPVSRS